MPNPSSAGINKKLNLVTCAGNSCPNLGKYPLTVIYLNKVGYFCEVCKNELIQEGLVTENNSTSDVFCQVARQTRIVDIEPAFHEVAQK